MITIFPNYRRIGSLTIGQAVDLVRASLNEQDNQRLQDLTIRMYLDSSKVEIAEKLMAANDPHYLYSFFASADSFTVNDLSGNPVEVYNVYNDSREVNALDGRVNIWSISLDEALLDERIPADYIHSIRTLNLIGYGNCAYVTAERFFTISADQSFLPRESVFWTYYADKILICQGIHAVDVTDIANLAIERQQAVYEVLSYRFPEKDDFLLPGLSNRYHASIDVPQKLYRTLIMLTQKLCLESLGKTLVPEAESLLSEALGTLAQAKEASIVKGQTNE